MTVDRVDVTLFLDSPTSIAFHTSSNESWWCRKVGKWDSVDEQVTYGGDQQVVPVDPNLFHLKLNHV